MTPSKDPLKVAIEKLELAKVSSCDCQTKTYDYKHHASACGYRRICEAQEAVKILTALSQTLVCDQPVKEQEPYAWAATPKPGNTVITTAYPAVADQWRRTGESVIPLFAAPAQQEAKPEKTMGEVYEDGSDHIYCDVCGLCKNCGDCASDGCGENAQAEAQSKPDNKGEQ